MFRQNITTQMTIMRPAMQPTKYYIQSPSLNNVLARVEGYGKAYTIQYSS